MQRFVNQYLNEIVSLAMMCLMIIAFIHTQSQGSADGQGSMQESAVVTIVVETNRR